MTKDKNDKLFRAECADLCGIHPVSWDNYIKHGYVVPDGTTPPNKKWFYRSTVEAFKKKLRKRKKGLPFFIGE